MNRKQQKREETSDRADDRKDPPDGSARYWRTRTELEKVKLVIWTGFEVIGEIIRDR